MVEAIDLFAFLHEVEAVAGDEFDEDGIAGEQFGFTLRPREHLLLLFNLLRERGNSVRKLFTPSGFRQETINDHG